MERGTGARSAVLVVLACFSSGLLAGCARGNPYSLPDYDPAAAVALGPSAPSTHRPGRPFVVTRAAEPPAAVTYRPADAWGEGAWVERGRVAASTAGQRAVVDAVTRYISVRVQLSNTWRVDERALAAVASGQAVTSARERAESQRERQRRSIGRFIVNLSAVRVTGSGAVVSGCDFDATSEVDDTGNVLIPPVGGVLITMQLRRTDGTWRVLDWPAEAVPACDWRTR
jgi:hypothetical protein